MPNNVIHRALSPWAWWRHQMETFSALLAICAGNSPVPGEFPTQRPVTRSFGVFFDLRLNNRLSKQSWGWWFETRSRPLWRHCNGNTNLSIRKKLAGCRPLPKIVCEMLVTWSRRTHDAIITSLLRQIDVATLFWRNNDAFIASCVRCGYITPWP